MVQEQYYGAEGQPIRCQAGYFTVTRVYNDQGKVTEEAYFDENNQPALRDGQYCKVVRTYGDDGKVATETFLLPDGSETAKAQ